MLIGWETLWESLKARRLSQFLSKMGVLWENGDGFPFCSPVCRGGSEVQRRWREREGSRVRGNGRGVSEGSKCGQGRTTKAVAGRRCKRSVSDCEVSGKNAGEEETRCQGSKWALAPSV